MAGGMLYASCVCRVLWIIASPVEFASSVEASRCVECLHFCAFVSYEARWLAKGSRCYPSALLRSIPLAQPANQSRFLVVYLDALAFSCTTLGHL